MKVSFESQYFRLYKDYRSPFPVAQPSASTALAVGHPHPVEVTEPLAFSEAFPKHRLQGGQVLGDFLFSEAGALLSRRAAELLQSSEASGYQLLPALFEDARGEMHRDFLYLHVPDTESLIDLERSVRLPMPAGAMATLDEIKFNDAALQSMEPEERLLVKCWDVTNGGPFFHQDLVAMFSQARLTGFTQRSVQDYRYGIEFQERR